MKEVATLYRAAQLVAHNAHNLTKGPNFFADHAFFGETYAAYEAAYDAIVERMIGLDQEVDLGEIAKDAAAICANYDSPDFVTILKLEKDIVSEIESVAKKATLGTNDLLAGLADESETRQYKIGQRISTTKP